MTKKGHITLDEIKVQKNTLQSKIESAINDYTKQTGLTPVVECTNIYGEIGFKARSLMRTEIKITQEI